MNIEAVAWKETSDKRAKEFKYVIQVENVDGRSEKKVDDLLSDWNTRGSGSPSSGSIMMLYSRNFNDVKSWLKWARDFPYKLEELASNDERRILSWGKTTAKPTGRQCGKCGEYGHNARTCGKPKQTSLKQNPVKKQRKKRDESGPRKCGKCGESGHNARTCLKKK